MSTRKNKSQSNDSVHVNRTVPARGYVQTRNGTNIPVLKVAKPFQGFVDFVREQGVVGLGIGFVIGTSANTLVKSVVTNIINPVVGLLTGGIDLSKKEVCLKSAGRICRDAINYGQVISDIITFLAIIVVVYIVVKSMHLEKLDKAKKS